MRGGGQLREGIGPPERTQDDYPLRHGKYRKGIAGDWENAFSERDTEIFKETAGDLLIGLGYEKDDTW